MPLGAGEAVSQPPLTDDELTAFRAMLTDDARKAWLLALLRRWGAFAGTLIVGLISFRDALRDLVQSLLGIL